MVRGTLLVLLASAATLCAQPAVRHATNIAALLAYPGFYHARPVLIVGTVALKDNNQLRVSDEGGSIRVIFKGTAPDGVDEVRGEFWDLGRMKADEARLQTYDLRATFGVDPEGPWPRAGEVTAIIATAIAPAAPPVPTIRGMVLNPARYLDQKVTVTGQFSGRNLLGDVPDAPGKSRYDFVLRSADAAIWVINMRPKGKDQGKDFELGLDARIDTARWLEVSGRLQQARGLLWIDAEAGSLTAVKPPAETSVADEPAIRVPAGPPPEVMFSAPTQDETDVSMGSTVRIQFSRDIDQATLKNQIRVSYLTAQSVERGEPTTPIAEFTTEYAPANRVLELKFAKPLERFRTVKVELLEGILGTDKQPLKPWALTFEVGGS